MDADYLTDSRALLQQQRFFRQQIGWLDECVRSQGNLSRNLQIRVWHLEQRVHELGAAVSALREVLLQRSVISRADYDLQSLD